MEIVSNGLYRHMICMTCLGYECMGVIIRRPSCHWNLEEGNAEKTLPNQTTSDFRQATIRMHNILNHSYCNRNLFNLLSNLSMDRV